MTPANQVDRIPGKYVVPMPLAMRHATLGSRRGSTISRIGQVHVSHIYAVTVGALMRNHRPIGNRPVVVFPQQSVDRLLAATFLTDGVATVVVHPGPTAAVSFVFRVGCYPLL